MGQGRGRWDRKPVQNQFVDALSSIDWRDFERLIADYYRDLGYQVQHAGTAASGSTFDGGVDLRLRKDGKLTLVQCKRDSVFQTSHNVVNELLGIRVNEGADHAIVITSGEFTAAAKRFGSQGHVQLIDGVELRRMLGARLDGLARPQPKPLHAEIERIAWQAMDHLASERRTRRGPGMAQTSINLIIAKGVVGLLGLLLIVVFATVVVPRMFGSMLEPLSQRTRANTTPTAPPTEPVPPGRISASQAPPATTSSLLPSQAVAPVDRRSQAERDAEVQRYLERVPELTHYRYSPLEQDREPQPAPTDATSRP